MHAAHSPVDHYRLRGGRMSSRQMIPEMETMALSEAMGWWRASLHYYLLLPQVGGLLLKNYGGFQQNRYALFKRRFSKNAFIDSFGGGIR
jgi:hypothetical protein